MAHDVISEIHLPTGNSTIGGKAQNVNRIYLLVAAGLYKIQLYPHGDVANESKISIARECSNRVALTVCRTPVLQL